MKKTIKLILFVAFFVLTFSITSLFALAETEAYTVTWIIDGERFSEKVKTGEIPVFKSNIEDTDEEYDYYLKSDNNPVRINGWDREITAVTSNVVYTASVEEIYFSLKDTTAEKVYYYTDIDLRDAFSRLTGIGELKQYKDISLSASEKNPIRVPSVPKGTELYFDLNGHYYSQTGYGDDYNTHKQANFSVGQNAKLYVYSSVPGGKLFNSFRCWKDSSSTVRGSALVSIGSGAEVHFGKVTYNGNTYSGDNLSVYMASMCYNYGTGAMYIDGGSYNATISDAGGVFIMKGKSFILDVQNADLYSESGAFFRLGEDEQTTKEDPINVNFRNCRFVGKQNKATSFIYNAAGEVSFKMKFVGCEFAIGANVDFGRWTYIGENCTFVEGADLSKLRFDDGLVVWNANVNGTYSLNLNKFAFKEENVIGKLVATIKDSSFNLSESTLTRTFAYNTGFMDIQTYNSVTVSEGFVYKLYIPIAVRNAGGELYLNGEKQEFGDTYEMVEGVPCAVLMISGDDPLDAARTVNVRIVRTRTDGKKFECQWDASVVRYMDSLLGDSEYTEYHALAADYIAYINAICDYYGLKSQNVKSILNKYADKITLTDPADLGSVYDNISSVSGFFYQIYFDLKQSPELVFLIRPNARGNARIITTDENGETKSTLLERSQITDSVEIDGMICKKFVLPLGTRGLNFDITVKTYLSGNETASTGYNLATYLEGVKATNSEAYSEKLEALVHRMSAYSVSVNNYFDKRITE